VINPNTRDADLEARIDYQADLLRQDITGDEKRVAWSELVRLHGMRSPERVAVMEREAGLR
jgi:hypothetical protein